LACDDPTWPSDERLSVSRDGGSYLAFLGRISPEKRPDRAIEIAKRAGIPLKLAAKVDAVDVTYFKTEIEPQLDHSLIEFIGEIGEAQKSEFLEAMSVGTPVIAWPNGSVPEVIVDDVSGWIVDSIEAAAEAAQQASDMDRSIVRAEFERRFTAERMAEAYIAAYRSLLSCDSVSTALDRELMELSMAPRAVSEPSSATWEQLAGKRVAAVSNRAD
jgi:glycosyltransferase involved in cell wall biosynthesis